MENGLTIQLTNSVMRSPRGRRPTFRIEPKSTFIIIGVIISQMSTAIGTLMWLPLPNSSPRSAAANCGATEPMSTPPSMHRATHRVRYRSKIFSRFFMSAAL